MIKCFLLVEKLKQWLSQTNGETYMDHQMRYVFYFFLLLLSISLPIYTVEVAPSSGLYRMYNVVLGGVSSCLFLLFLFRKISLRWAFSFILLAIQTEICVEIITMALDDIPFQRLLIICNILLSTLFIMISACAYMYRLTFLMSFMSLAAYVFCAEITQGPFLSQFLFLNVAIMLLSSFLSYLMYCNVLKLQEENKMLKDDELKILQSLRLNREELFAFVELVSKQTSEQEAELLLEAIGPKAKDNLFKTVQRHILREKHTLDLIKEVFPELSATEQTICKLVLQDKTVAEICNVLYKSSGNITSHRSRIRAKLGLEKGDNLKEKLQERMSLYEREHAVG